MTHFFKKSIKVSSSKSCWERIFGQNLFHLNLLFGHNDHAGRRYDQISCTHE